MFAVNAQQVPVVDVKMGASICRAIPSVAEYCSVAMSVRPPVFAPARLVQHPAVTTAIMRIRSVEGTVDILANHVHVIVHGSVHTRNARYLVERSVTDRGATNHVQRSYRAVTRVLVFVARFARSCAEFATKISSARVNLEQCSSNCLTVVMCLKSTCWTNTWIKLP